MKGGACKRLLLGYAKFRVKPSKMSRAFTVLRRWRHAWRPPLSGSEKFHAYDRFLCLQAERVRSGPQASTQRRTLVRGEESERTATYASARAHSH